MILCAFAMTLITITLGSNGCRRDEDPCELYCDAEEDCADINNQKYSVTECMLHCETEEEKHESIGCGFEWQDFLECKTRLSCSNWNNISDRCAHEIDDINHCAR